MEPGTAEYLGNLLLSQGWTESLQPLDKIADQLGQFVDRPESLDQGRGSLLVDPPAPGTDGIRCHQEDFGCLLQGPTSGGAQFQDSHPLGGWVMWSPPGIDLSHADVLDANLLAELSHFLGQAVVVGFEPDLLVGAVGGPSFGFRSGRIGPGR